MHDLENDLELLTELDRWRVRSAHLRDIGQRALARSYSEDSSEWASSTLPVFEAANVLKAMLVHPTHLEFPHEFVEALEHLSLKSIVQADPDDVPVLRAAKTMCALATAPNSAFSPSVMFLYYYIIRAIYAADAPEWSMGGTPAGEGLSPRAYVTWECIKAILHFQRALENTAALIGGIETILVQRHERLSRVLPDAWERIDARRLRLDFATSLQTLRNNIALRLPILNTIDAQFETAAFARTFRRELKTELRRCARGFKHAAREIARYHATLRRSGDAAVRKRADRLETAHRIALGAVRDAAAKAERALQFFALYRDPVSQLAHIRQNFDDAARGTAKVLHPAAKYVERVLDRELAGAFSSTSQIGWDPAEMAFAAVAYGEATGRWGDERLRHAVRHLTSVISERGRFPLGRPIHTSERGYQLQPLNADVIRAFARVLQHVPAMDVDGSAIRSLMTYFEDTRSSDDRGIWYADEARGEHRGSRIATATAILALAQVNELLDDRINAIVFRHFSTRTPDVGGGPRLPDLFYGDYGLAACRDTAIRRSDSVAMVLERMRAHVLGVPAAGYRSEALFSVVLYGPPGTGKTTLMEALARSCGVTLVEVTPSDIVIGGADAIERRARAVFKALSLLTRAVVLFDEFDPVLLRRNVDETKPTVFSFLTPGMLPKLKSLHDCASRRSVAYALITNLVGKLDEAAIRAGRFDLKIGIYPPDLLSRAGRLRKAIAEFEASRRSKRLPLLPRPGQRLIWDVLRKTAGSGMNTLARRGWFTAPTDVPTSENNIFRRLYDPDCAELADLQPDAHFEPGRKLNGADAEREFREWLWVRLWDELATTGQALDQEPSSELLERAFEGVRNHESIQPDHAGGLAEPRPQRRRERRSRRST